MSNFKMAEEWLLKSLQKNFKLLVACLNWDVLTPALIEAKLLSLDKVSSCNDSEERLKAIIKSIKIDMNHGKIFLEVIEKLKDDPGIQKLLEILQNSKSKDPGMLLVVYVQSCNCHIIYVCMEK